MDDIRNIVLGVFSLVAVLLVVIILIKKRKKQTEDDLSDYTPADNYNEDFKSNGYNKAADYSDPKEYPFVKRALKADKISHVGGAVIAIILLMMTLILPLSDFILHFSEEIVFGIGIFMSVVLVIMSLFFKIPMLIIRTRLWTCPQCKKRLPRTKRYKDIGDVIVVDKCPHCGKDLRDIDVSKK